MQSWKEAQQANVPLNWTTHNLLAFWARANSMVPLTRVPLSGLRSIPRHRAGSRVFLEKVHFRYPSAVTDSNTFKLSSLFLATSAQYSRRSTKHSGHVIFFFFFFFVVWGCQGDEAKTCGSLWHPLCLWPRPAEWCTHHPKKTTALH